MYSRLQKLGLCLSITSTLKPLDVLGTDHYHIVMDWVKELSKLTTTSHVRTIFSVKNWWKVIIHIYFTGLHYGLPNSSDVQLFCFKHIFIDIYTDKLAAGIACLHRLQTCLFFRGIRLSIVFSTPHAQATAAHHSLTSYHQHKPGQ